ncbi:hypothetical protein T05_13736 [Trichinella murrelli]|uniref:Uncharacterized protein n=1 Tax=Trichinella murrelli TaxID=144512 RepID=A0A0V0SUE8_9BILA|nr:hypothetical protein T05_13736 [Trichinella murrelli]
MNLLFRCVASHFVENISAKSLFAHAKRDWYTQNFPIAQQSLF